MKNKVIDLWWDKWAVPTKNCSPAEAYDLLKERVYMSHHRIKSIHVGYVRYIRETFNDYDEKNVCGHYKESSKGGRGATRCYIYELEYIEDLL